MAGSRAGMGSEPTMQQQALEAKGGPPSCCERPGPWAGRLTCCVGLCVQSKSSFLLREGAAYSDLSFSLAPPGVPLSDTTREQKQELADLCSGPGA